MLALPVASCDSSVRLEVVEQGGSDSPALAGSGGTAGSGGSGASGGSAGEAGSPEPAGGNAGQPDEAAGAPAGGMPDVPPWEAAPLYTASFVPYGFPEQYVRHLDGTGVIALVDTGSTLDREAASFEMIPGMYATSNDDGQRCVSFRAVNKLGTFFRHSGSRIYLNPANDVPLFLADATFCEAPGLADPQTITFRCSNYPERVIHLRNVSELWIDDMPDPMTPEFAAAASFYRTTALVETPLPGQ